MVVPFKYHCTVLTNYDVFSEQHFIIDLHLIIINDIKCWERDAFKIESAYKIKYWKNTACTIEDHLDHGQRVKVFILVEH